LWFSGILVDVTMYADFTVVLRGYDRAEVDSLVERVHDATASDSPTARASAREELRRRVLRVRLRGYDRAQVDEYLRLMAEQLT
jgi:DivIVA domain-containing protein